MEDELEELSQHKMALKQSVEQLSQEESERRTKVEQLADKIKEHRKSFLKITQQSDEAAASSADDWPAPVSTEAQRRFTAGVSTPSSATVQFREDGDGKPPHPKERPGLGESQDGGGAELQESWMASGADGREREESPAEDSDAAMDILDLEPPPAPKVHTTRKSTPSAFSCHHFRRAMPSQCLLQRMSKTDWQGIKSERPWGGVLRIVSYLNRSCRRELCETLAEEKRSLSKTRAYLNQQQRSLKERQVAWERTHKQWNQGMKSHQARKVRGIKCTLLGACNG